MTTKNEKVVELIIESIRGSREFTFPLEDKVSQVISTAVSAFGFAPGDRFQLVLASDKATPLNPDRTLQSYKLQDKAVLILTAIGGGV